MFLGMRVWSPLCVRTWTRWMSPRRGQRWSGSWGNTLSASTTLTSFWRASWRGSTMRALRSVCLLNKCFYKANGRDLICNLRWPPSVTLHSQLLLSTESGVAMHTSTTRATEQWLYWTDKICDNCIEKSNNKQTVFLRLALVMGEYTTSKWKHLKGDLSL